MVIRKYEQWKDFYRFSGKIVDGVTFLASEETKVVYEACHGDKEKVAEMFRKIGIKFDCIIIVMRSCICYSVDGEDLTLADLSSGERFILYLLACKVLNEEVLAIGLFEVLDGRLTNVVYEELRDYEKLTILLFNMCLDPKFNLYMEAIA